MAEYTVRTLEKFCMHFYNHRNCPKGDSCKYPHKARFEVELVISPINEDYFMGHPRTAKVCRYYRRGNCMYQQNCHFRHDTDSDNVTATNYRNANNNQSTSASLPSTSSQSNNNKPEQAKEAEKELINSVMEAQKQENKRKSNAVDDESPRSKADNDDSQGACASPLLQPLKHSSWVNAPEFVPRIRSYAQAVHPHGHQPASPTAKMCPYTNKDGICRNLTTCTYLHNDMCDMCQRLVLHPFDEEQRKKHCQECLEQHEKNMELSFAIARSKEKTCGVCFEVIMEKATGEQRFGILPNCNHCFCLSCIRKWRQARQFENKIIRACPECRVTSDFVCPSMYWVDTKEDKEKLIEDYKKALSKKDCKYFKKGSGKCPFGNKCFYLHALPDGTKYDVGPPPRQRRLRGLDNSDIEVLQQVLLWEFLDDRDYPLMLRDDRDDLWRIPEDIEDLISFITDSEDSDWSDYELFL